MSAGEVRIALLGVGNRALPKRPDTSNFAGWVEQIARCPLTRLVAAQDPSPEARARMVERGRLPADAVFADASEMFGSSRADAVLVCTPGEFHAVGAKLALDASLHLLMEKPFVTDVSEGRELLARIKAARLTTTVVQNWRYKEVGRRIKDFITSGELGRVGHVFFRYLRNRENPSYPAYIFQEQYPLLYAMGSHHLDLIRHVLGEELAVMAGHNFRPPWSLYASWTGHNITLRSASGVFVVYTATASSQNAGLPQESLVIEGEKGTLVNDSDWSEPPLLFYPKGQKTPLDLTAGVADPSMRGQYDAADAFILEGFARAVLDGRDSDCPAADSFRSLELVEACRRACEAGQLGGVGQQAGEGA